MIKVCITHNTMAIEDGVWLKKMEDVTEIVRRNHYICSIERCPECQRDVQKTMEFLRGDHGKTRQET
jgi:hypothetical protein